MLNVQPFFSYKLHRELLFIDFKLTTVRPISLATRTPIILATRSPTCSTRSIGLGPSRYKVFNHFLCDLF